MEVPEEVTTFNPLFGRCAVYRPEALATVKAVRPRGGKAKPAAVTGFRHPPPPPSGKQPPPGHEELKDLIKGYKGFGILTLIRALMFRDWRSFLMALIGVVLLVGQWTGPVGFIAFKLTSDDMEYCERGGGKWARFLMASVAMIYFARLSLAALSHKQKIPPEFSRYNIPKWWGIYRHADLVLTSLLYDTFIFLANLLVVFQDRAINDMIVDVLALEFFTLIDDEFKAAVIEYDSTFLYEMIRTTAGPTGPAELPGPQRHADDYAVRSSSYMDPPVRRKHRADPPYEPSEDDVESRQQSAAIRGGVTGDDGPETCADVAIRIVLASLKCCLLVVRFICRMGGPLCTFVMIVYGPYCLGRAS